MQAQYNFIQSELAQGHTVLAYNRRVAMKPIRVRANDCAMIGGVLHIKGIPAKGWTICRKPKA